MSAENEQFVDVSKNGKEFCYKSSEPNKLLCRKCHSPVDENATRCPVCNNNFVESKGDSNPSAPYWYNNGASSQPSSSIPNEYTPISMWGYFGYEILFNIPIIGWLILIFMALSASNHNVKNFARAHFCFLIVIVIALLLGAGSIISPFLR